MFYEVTNPFVDLKAESNPQFFSKDVTCIDPSAKPVRHVEQLIEELQSTLTTGDLCSAGKVNTWLKHWFFWTCKVRKWSQFEKKKKKAEKGGNEERGMNGGSKYWMKRREEKQTKGGWREEGEREEGIKDRWIGGQSTLLRKEEIQKTILTEWPRLRCFRRYALYLAIHNLLYILLHTPVHRKEDTVLQNQKQTSCHKMMVNSCICTCSERICLNRTTLPRRVYQRQLIFDPCGAHSTVRTTSNKSKIICIKFSPFARLANHQCQYLGNCTPTIPLTQHQ